MDARRPWAIDRAIDIPHASQTEPPQTEDEPMTTKRILLIATGGTIASAEEGRGLSPALTGQDLVRAVPELDGLCDIDIVQPMNIDSTNMRPADWLRIRDALLDGYADHDGFVILHGTDTMAYTAAALSYLVPGSAKPIVLTGSQRPMGASFTDAKLNLYQSLLVAVDDRARDVMIVFGGKVIAGTRARKQRTQSANAFTSVNYPLLARLYTDRIVWGAEMGSEGVSRAGGTAGAAMAAAPTAPMADDAGLDALRGMGLNERVCTLKLTPGLTPQVFDLLAPAYDAVILETFGMGGVPETVWPASAAGTPNGALGSGLLTFERAIFDWVDAGRTVVMTTQVPEEGLDLGIYEVGRAYADHPGILKGADMTTEALVAKTMWALGRAHDADELARLFYAPINHDRSMCNSGTGST